MMTYILFRMRCVELFLGVAHGFVYSDEALVKYQGMKRFRRFFIALIILMAIDAGSVPLIVASISVNKTVSGETAILLFKLQFYWKTLVAVIASIVLSYSLYYFVGIALAFVDLLAKQE